MQVKGFKISKIFSVFIGNHRPYEQQRKILQHFREGNQDQIK